MIWAHSENEKGEGHLLESHLVETARLAGEFTSKFGAEELGYLAGLWHDVGKKHPAFQSYLRGQTKRPATSHKAAGTVFAASHFEPLAVIISGHHGGLPEKSDLKNKLKEWKASTDVEETIEKAKSNLITINKLPEIKTPAFLKTGSNFDAELFIRMLFSALVDADFLDTEAHFQSEKSDLRGTGESFDRLRDKLEAAQAALSGLKTDRLNLLRHEVYLASRKAAESNPGFFRMTVPTGGGKTLSSISFAINHALKNNLDRVIVAIPYTSIIDQTVKVYRDIFGDENVIEHHSAISDEESEDYDVKKERNRLISENWDAPLVVTTTVQLFESLFSNKPSRCRKLHNTANSVIILDEAQTLPTELLDPILDALRQLVKYYGSSVLFCTATQPAFDEHPRFKEIKGITEIAPNPADLFKQLKRVDYEMLQNGSPCSWQDVAEVMRSERQCMAIVNTRKDALALLEALGDNDALHLSTLLCGEHRRNVLKDVRERLHKGQDCRLVSTQVVEAGVDLDFPLVMRAIGPLDRIVQAAGRCNREAKLDKGRVIIFDPAEGATPGGSYRTGIDTAKTILAQGMSLHDPETYKYYFKNCFQVIGENTKIMEARKSFNYPETARLFKMIKDNTRTVLVPYKLEKAKPEIQRLMKGGAKNEKGRSVLRRLQPYTIGLYEHDFNEAMKKGVIKPLDENKDLWLWIGKYDDKKGIAEIHRDPADLIV